MHTLKLMRTGNAVGVIRPNDVLSLPRFHERALRQLSRAGDTSRAWTGLARCFAIALVINLVGCVLRIPDLSLPKSVQVSEHDRVGRVVRSAAVDEQDGLHQRLRSFLANERNGWFWTLAGYAPGTYVFRGDGIEVHCSERAVTVNFLEGGEWKSYTKSVDGALAYFDLPSAFPKPEQSPSSVKLQR
ncbi:hypothetical protein [Hydrogenophaga flava]|uniref:hypothetical protein n=1 Tax=Hydrogenophaga flava TaxID=65657 RepID=UPI0008267C7A|nr:hypothetical protein [Hydrogenophaga flava]